MGTPMTKNKSLTYADAGVDIDNQLHLKYLFLILKKSQNTLMNLRYRQYKKLKKSTEIQIDLGPKPF